MTTLGTFYEYIKGESDEFKIKRSRGASLQAPEKFLKRRPQRAAPTEGNNDFASNLKPPTVPSSTHVVFFSRKGLSRSMGMGKIVVEFFSVATSVRVCKNLN